MLYIPKLTSFMLTAKTRAFTTDWDKSLYEKKIDSNFPEFSINEICSLTTETIDNTNYVLLNLEQTQR